MVYQLWVEDQIEEYKDSVPRTDLLRLADEVCEDLRVNQRGQYQLTEILLCEAVDRKIFRLLKLPGYRTWARARRSAANGFPDPQARAKTDEVDSDAGQAPGESVAYIP